mgnify:FL=1
MTNSVAMARKWVEFLVGRPEFPAGDYLRSAFDVAKITRVCDCGCNSVEVEVPADSGLVPLVSAGGYGPVFEMQFNTADENCPVAIFVFVGANGHIASLDVDYCGNARPMPEEPVLLEPPFHVELSRALLVGRSSAGNGDEPGKASR